MLERSIAIHLTADGLIVGSKDLRHRVHKHTHHWSAHHAGQKSLDREGHAGRTAGRSASLNTGSAGPTATPPVAARLSWDQKSVVEPLGIADLPRALEGELEDCQLDCFGIIGKLNLFSNSYLLVVSQREHSGDFLHPSRPVYRCTGVLAIPLNRDGAESCLRLEAQKAAKNAKSASQNSETSSEEEDESDSDEVETPSVLGRESFFAPADGPGTATLRPSDKSQWARMTPRSASESNVSSRGYEGRVLTVADDTERVPDLTSPTPNPSLADSLSVRDPAQAVEEANRAELEDKLVKEATRQWSRGEIFFSYDFDLTTSLQRKHEQAREGRQSPTNIAKGTSTDSCLFEEPRLSVPLCRRADRKFFHNEHMLLEFMRAGLYHLCLPTMQGYFQTSELPLERILGLEEPDATAQLTVISRRSKERPGLRYQRRGINDAGQVANYVETEQILLVERGGQRNVFSFVQFRGSIPLFWSQSPFSLKPPPVLERSDVDNRKACAKHFAAQVERYSRVTCINLAEQSGKEGQITEAYRRAIEDLSASPNFMGDGPSPPVEYVAFDFHKECAGMKFENVSRLIDNLERTLQTMDYFWRSFSGPTAKDDAATAEGATPQHGDGALSKQRGAFRVSCLDCLDRTNVVQSALARHVLYAQLARVGIARSDPATKDERFDYVFNDMWANNGDQISQCYAGSRALKGDFTRTGRRNWAGMFNDATASVYRMVQGAVTDFWRQTVISFTYGELTLKGLEKFSDELQTVDPSNETRLARVRAAAIETCTALVLADSESVIGAWTLFAPLAPNTVQSDKLEEKIVLLTSRALYICAYDFTAEKVSEYSRILLGDIVGLQKGQYVISPKEGFQPEQHWGLIVSYLNESTRVNVRSVKNVPAQTQDSRQPHYMAFKAVSHEFAGTLEREQTVLAPRPPHSRLDKSDGTATMRSTVTLESLLDYGNDETLTSKRIVEAVVTMLLEECAAAGAYDPATDGQEGTTSFVQEKSIQSLTDAKAHAPLFAGLLDGLKRRVWL
ncbi:unnamed protein product [Parajaminaea phylloscopi]